MKPFSRARVAIVAAAVTMLGVLVVLPTGASATTYAGPPGCSTTISTDGHSATAKCSGIAYHGKAYKVTASTCSTSGCSSIGSAAVAYGTAVSLSGGSGYIASNSIVYHWANATTSSYPSQWCTFTKVGGTVSWCDIQASIQYWAGSVQPLYDESGGTHPSNWYHDQQYRPDCSGTTSMSWHANTSGTDYGYVTGTLDDSSVSHQVTLAYSTSLSYVQPGDTLDDTVEGHAVIFAGWDTDHVHFKVWSFGIPGTHFTTADLLDHQPDSSGRIAYEPAGHYKAYRYNHSTGKYWG